MKRNLLKTFLFGVVIAVMLLQMQCKPGGLLTPPPPDTTSHSTVEYKDRWRDTSFATAPDSSWVFALLVCDENNKVLVKELETRDSKLASITHVVNKNNDALRLQFTCHCDSSQIYFQWKERDTSIHEAKTIIKNYPVAVPAQNTAKEKFYIGTGPYLLTMASLFALLVLGGIVVGALKILKKI